jgi:FixJ family two-component response regulator
VDSPTQGCNAREVDSIEGMPMAIKASSAFEAHRGRVMEKMKADSLVDVVEIAGALHLPR